jgi:hypothetical protein
MKPEHRHTLRATLYDGRWVEYCEAMCGVPYRKARMRPNGVPVALARMSPKGAIEQGRQEAARGT